MDRRAFLRGMVASAGLVTVGACRRGGSSADVELDEPAKLLPAGELPPRDRPTLRVPGGDVGVPTPFGYRIPPGYFTVLYAYDTLLWTDPSGELVPWLAIAHQVSPDRLTYTFELRDGVRWHDGRPLTAADVAFTFQFFAAHRARLSPLLLFTPQFVRDVRALGDRIVEIRLERPVVTFLRQVAARVPIVPRHVWSTVADPATQDPALVVGSGPYRLAEYSSVHGAYRFEAYDGFFLGRPFVKDLELRRVSDELTGLLAGDVDVASTTGPTDATLAPFRRNRDFGLVGGPPDTLFALYWNLGAGGPLADVRFRRACARAIDRTDLVNRLAGGRGEMGNPGFLPEDHPYRVAVEQYQFDQDAAERLLDEAGYSRAGKGPRVGPDGTPLRFKLLSPAATPGLSELVVVALGRVGIELQIEPTDFLFPEMSQGKFDMAVSFYGGHQGDPDIMRQVYSSRADPKTFRSARGYANPEMDEAAAAQLVAHDEAERRRLVGRMQEIAAADLPLLHLYYPRPVVIHRKSVIDQVLVTPEGLGPLNKQVLVTGVATGGTDIRPTT